MVDFRMNQAASAQRTPAGSTTTAGSCCPLFNNLFFMNTFAPQAPLLATPEVVQQCPQLARLNANQRTQHQQPNAVLPALQTLNQQLSDAVGQQQQLPHRPLEHNNNNNYNTSNLSLQHLVANRHSAHSCMYLAAALARASAGFRQSQHQQPQQHPQNHQTTPINQSTNATVNSVNPVASSTNNSNNQVPLLNLNNYSSAPPFLDLSSVQAPPLAAHLSSSPIANIQRLTNSIPNQNPAPQNLAPSGNNGASAPSAQRQQQQASNFRDVQQHPHQQSQSQSTPVQQLFQDFNDQFQAILLNQLFPNQQFASTISAQTTHGQQMTAQQVNSARPQTLPQIGQLPVVMPPAQHISQRSQQQISEPVSEIPQQQQNFQTQAPDLRNESFTQSANNTSSMYRPAPQSAVINQQQQQPQHTTNEPVTQLHQIQAAQNQGPQPQFMQQQQQQQPQPQSAIPPITLYSLPQMEQALALLSNPTVANNLFSHVFNLYLQTGLRSEPHDTYHSSSHHFHHLHNSHHHHHHNHPNGQVNGQDSTVPLDSLAITESKPRGLNRAEIDSLTPYIHTNEKDARTCVICLSKFELKAKIRPLPCNHAFHAKCVDKWLRANRTCPICRRDALKTYNAKLKRI